MTRVLLAVAVAFIMTSCEKDKFADVAFDNVMEAGNGEFLIVDSLYYPTDISQPQFVKFKFHLTVDTSLFHHINVFNGPALFQQLPHYQKDKFEFNNPPGATTYVFYFKLVDNLGRESRKSKSYLLFVN